MLISGTLRAPMDVFDIFLHGTPWFLVIAKAATLLNQGETPAQKSE